MTKLQSENEQKLNRIEAEVTECERELSELKKELSPVTIDEARKAIDVVLSAH